MGRAIVFCKFAQSIAPRHRELAPNLSILKLIGSQSLHPQIEKTRALLNNSTSQKNFLRKLTFFFPCWNYHRITASYYDESINAGVGG
jgi:hypothetical protein